MKQKYKIGIWSNRSLSYVQNLKSRYNINITEYITQASSKTESILSVDR